MDDPIRLLLTNAAAAGLLALLAWTASRTVRRQAVVHGLWLLALARLVVPPIAPLPLVPEWVGLALTSSAATPVVVPIPPPTGDPGRMDASPLVLAEREPGRRTRGHSPPRPPRPLAGHVGVRQETQTPSPLLLPPACGLATRRVAGPCRGSARDRPADGLALRAVQPAARLRAARPRSDRAARLPLWRSGWA